MPKSFSLPRGNSVVLSADFCWEAIFFFLLASSSSSASSPPLRTTGFSFLYSCSLLGVEWGNPRDRWIRVYDVRVVGFVNYRLTSCNPLEQAQMHYGSEQPDVGTSHHSLSRELGSEWMSEQTNELSGVRKRSKAKQMNNCVSKQIIEWPNVYVLILGWTEP